MLTAGAQVRVPPEKRGVSSLFFVKGNSAGISMINSCNIKVLQAELILLKIKP